MVSTFFSPTSSAYICVVWTFEWFSILETVYMSEPTAIWRVAYVWRKQWNVMCFVIPASLIHFGRSLYSISRFSPLNMIPFFLLPQ